MAFLQREQLASTNLAFACAAQPGVAKLSRTELSKRPRRVAFPREHVVRDKDGHQHEACGAQPRREQHPRPHLDVGDVERGILARRREAVAAIAVLGIDGGALMGVRTRGRRWKRDGRLGQSFGDVPCRWAASRVRRFGRQGLCRVLCSPAVRSRLPRVSSYFDLAPILRPIAGGGQFRLGRPTSYNTRWHGVCVCW